MFTVHDSITGHCLSNHRLESVAIKKVHSFGKKQISSFIANEDQSIEHSGDAFYAKNVPGILYRIESSRCFSNSAYHRCGGAYWSAYQLVPRQVGTRIDDQETVYTKVPLTMRNSGSRRGDECLSAIVKLDPSVKKIVICVGKKSSFSSTLNKNNPDYIEEEIDLSECEIVRVIADD